MQFSLVEAVDTCSFSQHVFSVDEKSKGVMETNQPTNRKNLGTFILGNFD